MKKITLLFLILPFLGLSQTQIGQDIDGQIIGRNFGWSSSLSEDGNKIAVGAPYYTNSTEDLGFVAVFENINDNWTQIGNNINGIMPKDRFGFSIDLSSNGNIVAIGGPLNDDFGDNAGIAKVFEINNGNWTQVGENLYGLAGDEFGHAISISGDGSIIAVGARTAPIDNFAYVKIFMNISDNWIQIGETIYGETPGSDVSDVSLSADGTIIAISDAGNNDNGFQSGIVKVYEYQSSSWVQIGQNLYGDANSDQLGGSIEISPDGNILATGAGGNDGNGQFSGQVKIFERVDNFWIQKGNDIYGEYAFDLAGSGVSLSYDGNIVSFGATQSVFGSQNGKVLCYKYINDVWTKIGENINGDSSNNRFGFSTSLSYDGFVLSGSSPFNSFGQVKIYSISGALALSEVVEDILGNTNGINVTADQLNSINGVSGAIDGVNYTTALDNGSFVDENNPTAAEIQFIIDQVNATLSISDTDVFNFKLYPNPTKTQFTIQLDASVQLQQVSIYNLLGQEVLTSEDTQVDISKLSSGSYLVEIKTNKGLATKQLIKD